MPKIVATQTRTKKKEEKQKDYASLFYDKGKAPVDRRQKRDELADLYRQREALNTNTGSAGQRKAAEANYYANRARFASTYGDTRDYENSYRAYNQAMADARSAYTQDEQARDRTSKRSQVMMQGFHSDKAKQAQSELEYAARRQQGNADFYNQMARDAASLGDKALFDRADAGYQRSAGDFGEAFQRYNRAMDAYNEDLRQKSPGIYYAQSMSREDLEAKVKDLRQKRDTAQQVLDTTPWSDGMGGTANSKALSVDKRIKELNDELAVYEQALKQRGYWDNTAKYEEFVGAFTKDGELTPEAKALAEQGKAAYERDKAGKRPTSAYAGYASMAPSYQTDLRLGSADDQERRSRQDTERPHYAKTYEERGVDDGYLSEAQKELYYALYARDPEIAREYLTLAQEKAENDYFQRVSDFAGKNFLTQWYGMQGAAISGLMSGLDPYGEFGQALSKTSEAITRGGAQAWNEVTGTFDEDVPILGGKGLGDLYGLGVSMIESGIVAMAASAVGDYSAAAGQVAEFLGTALMGSSASASDYRECLQRGMTKDQAATHGLAAGIAEAAFEYISIDKLVNQDVTRGLVKNFFVQGGVEASEEVCTSVANRVTDALLARAQGYDTQIEQRVKELLAMGVDRREAERKAEQEWLTEVINDGIGGFLSGGLMTVGNTVGNWNEYRAAMEQNRMEGQMTRQSGQTDALRQYAEANDLGWYGQEIDAEAVKSGVEPVQSAETGKTTTAQDASEQTRQQTRQEKRQERQAKREQKRQLREQSKQDRQIGSDTQRVQAHIQEQFAGKSIQEQTQLRDQMIEQYGNGIAPAVYEAISVEAAKKAAGLKGADEIRAARDQAVSETQDRAMKRAIADGYDQAVFGQAMRSGNADEAGRYFQQIRNTGEGGMTMEATVKDQDGQSRQIAITGMTEDGKGVKLADGSTVAVSKLQADADTMDAVQRISELEMGADADAVLQAYIKADKSGVDGYRWLMDYSLAYEQGRTGKLSLEEAVKRSSLDQRTVLEAYTLGQRNAHQETRSAVEALKAMPRKAGITGKTSNIDTSEIEGITLNESEREQFEFANKIFSLIGVDVKWKASAVQNGRYVGANGSYLNGVVTLDVHAGRNFIDQVNSGVLATMGHELTHFLQQYAPEQYQALKEFLFRQIVQGSANGETRLERLIWEKQRRSSSKLSRKAAEDEVVADACQTMLRDSKTIREFAQQDEEAAKGVVRWLDKWFGKLKQAFSRSAQLTEEARFVDGLAQEVREAFGKLWDEALREAVEVHDRVGNIEKPQQQQNSDRDTEYLELAKDPEKNAARLQEMVDEAAREAGARTIGGSKVMKYYHGTGKRFTKFEANKSKRGTYGYGFYFTPVQSFAENYGHPLSVYIMTNNFATHDDNKITENQVREIVEKYNIPLSDYVYRPIGDIKTWVESHDDLTIIQELQRYIDSVSKKRAAGILKDFHRVFGYDGVRQARETVLWDNTLAKSADPVTYDDSGNVIPLSERFNAENQDIRFSMRDPVETTDRLIALHNLSAEKLGKALALGGFPMPSIAVTKTSIPHTNFGPITLVMDKSTIDPMKDRRNTVYSADAWTPTFPSVEYEVNEKAASRLRKKYFEIMEKYGKDAADPLYPWANYAEDELNRKGGPEEILDRYRKDPDMMKLYLVDNGLNVPATVTEETVERMDESTVKFYDTFVQEMGKDVFEELMVRKGETAQDVKKRWYAEHGDDFEAAYRKYMQGMGFSEEEIGNVLNNETISSLTRQAINIRNYLRTGAEKRTVTTNVTATNNAIREAVDSKKYDAWLRELFDGIVKSQGIYNGKDRFTPSGNERSFAATHYSVTLENIAKAMAAQNDGNSRNVSGFYGVKSLRAGTAKRFSSIAEMHKYEGRLQHLTEEQAEKINEALSDRLGNVMGQIYDSKPHGKYDNSFIAMDAIGENLMEITEQKNITNASIQRVFSKYGYQISDTLAGEVRALLFDISQMPVNIYEAKPERAVRFDEVLAAIVPTDTDKALLEKLRDAGVQNLIEYAAGDDTDRLAKVNSVEGAQFSERDYDLPSDLELMDRAIEGLSEAGGEEYWKALLETDPGLAEDVKGYKDQAKKLAAAEKRLADYKKQMQLAGKLKPLGMQRLLKAEREKAAAKAEQHKDEVFQNYKERQQQSKLRGRIKNLSDDMKRRMTNPSERAYVPASLYGSMTQLCDALDDLLAPGTGTKAEARYRAVMDKIHGLAAEYQAVKDLDDPTYSSEYDEEIQHEINELVKTLNGRTSTTELSTEELQKVYNIMKYINYCMTTAKDLMGSTQFKDVYSAMRSVVNQQQGEKSLKSLSKHEKAKRLRMLDNLSVMRAVEMMSGWDRSAALYQLFHAIEQGTDASWAWVMDYNKSLQDLKTGKNEKAYRKALTEAMDFGITDEEGLKVTMTKMQAIQILMTAEREAHNDKLLHLQTGGAVIRNAEDIQNGKGAKATSQTVKVTPELLQKIQDSLTDWDRAYMKAVREYFQREGKRTNEILYKLKHRVLQTEEFYVPYSVDKNYLETNLDERQAMSMWVKTPGSTNALQQKAKQPVIIDGMDAAMERHVKEIADYIGLALPIRDFSKVYNGMLKTGGDNPLPVKETIDRAFGSKGQHLLTQAVIDVQGGSAKQNWSSGISDFLSGLQSAFVRSALLVNPSVTIKQAASYIAAESILSHRALVAGNRATFSSDETKSPALIAYLFANPEGKTAQRIYNEIDRYTSLHYQRRLGMSQAEIANEANRTGKLKRRMNMIGANMEQSKIGHAVRKTGENLNPVTWIQRMDVATTATLWVACKEQAKLDGMKAGTAEFWQRTTELYERCLRETQPMYDGLHRTAHQKQAGGLVQFLFPFRTVPIQNHGQLAASYEALKASRNKSKAEQAEAKRFFAKTVWAQTESAFVFSLMTFLAAALKRKTKKYRDEDEELTALSAGKGLLTDVGSTLFSVLVPMYGSELVSWAGRALDKFEGTSGYSYDAFQVGVVDMLNDLASSFDKIAADFGKIARGEDVSFGDVGSHGLAMLLKAAKLAGIPADTVRTYFNGIVGNVEDIANGRIPALNDESWERATGVNAKRFFEAWEAGDEAKMQTVLNEVRQSGKSEDSIANAFNSYAKDAYENNGLSLEQYADYLDKTGMFDAEKISGKVKNLVRDEYQAGERSEDEAISALTEICGMDEDGAWKTVQRWEAGAEHEGEEDYSYSQYEDLREALDAGKSLKEAGKEYLAHGYTEEQIAAQAVSWLKDQVTAGKINENRAIQLLRQYKGMDTDKAWKKVQEWKAKAEHAEDEDYSWSQYDEIDAAIDGNKDIKALVQKLTSHGVEEKTVSSHIKSYLIQRYEDKAVTESQFRNQLSRYCGIVAKKDVDEIVNNANCFRDSGFHYSELKTAYNAKELSGDKARQMLVKYGGLSKNEAQQKTRFWDFEVQHPDANLSIEKVNAYYDIRPANYGKTMEQAGISVQSYVSYCQQASKAQGTDLNHDGRTDSGSKKAAVMRIIDGLNLTRSQKDALYYLNGWSPKTIYEAPWH